MFKKLFTDHLSAKLVSSKSAARCVLASVLFIYDVFIHSTVEIDKVSTHVAVENKLS